MKRFLAVMLSLAVLLPSVHASGPDDDYVAIYSLIQQGDMLNEKGELGLAATKYTEAQNALKRFQTSYPDLYTKVVKFRLNYLDTKLSEISAKAGPASTNGPVKPVEPTTNAPAKPAISSANAEYEQRIQDLQEQIRRLQADQSLTEAKLKEALAARPAEVDPQELAKAREQITSLQKENELLKASIDSAKTNAAATANAAANLQKMQQALDEANRKVTALTDANATLKLEKDALQQHMQTPVTADPSAAALREENELLKKEVAELKKHPAPVGSADALQRKLLEARAQIATLQSDKEVLRLEKTALEIKVKNMTGTPVSATATTPVATAPAATTNVASATNIAPEMLDSVTASRIAQLEAQRDELQKSLDAALRDAEGRKKGKLAAERIDEMTRQLAALRARIEVLEANPVPYTDDEKALFSKPGLALSASVHGSPKGHKAPAEPPAAARALLAEGRRYFMAHDFENAQAKYNEALKLDPKNYGILSDLASIQLEAGHTADAEKNVKAALSIEPNDDFSLFVLGQVKFQAKSYDEALDALSRAAEVNPSNAKIQNFLGLTLSEKGLRSQAETAFRKAIQLDPGFADAHMNLAVVYATAQPPLIELARWHYQKGLAAGHAPNPALEKLLEQGGHQSAAK